MSTSTPCAPWPRPGWRSRERGRPAPSSSVDSPPEAGCPGRWAVPGPPTAGDGPPGRCRVCAECRQREHDQGFRQRGGTGLRHLETDVRASADGEAFCFHDDDLVRVVGQERLFGELSGEQIRSLRTLGGESIPSLAEVLEAFPDTRFNIDVKTDDVLEPMLGVLDEFQAYHRVLIGSFSSTRLNLVRRERPHLATSTSPRESMGIGYGVGPAATRAARSGALCLQVPIRYRGRRVLTPRTVRAAKRQKPAGTRLDDR
ncbi:glycerophosphodiester phosphodiesterase family protein [Sanguibacter sp. Z1732]|uniref:glycerophosphodiester phosphodiesterase family protein n=1 Tax=Sanguibacter sp. Z1732 TaxID=3435412 RepID=UPI003D9CB5AD